MCTIRLDGTKKGFHGYVYEVLEEAFVLYPQFLFFFLGSVSYAKRKC